MATDINMTSGQGPSRLLCILGMHRSGTSAVTRFLHALGAKTGPDLLGAMDGVNEAGFWEDSRVVELNERLLAGRSSRWQDYAALARDATDPLQEAAIRSEAASHFAGHYLASGTWVVKDPRLCRLLPFWLDVWQGVGIETCFVHVLRHPYAVAKSLHQRDKIPCEYGTLLWLQYTLEAMSHSGGQPCIVVEFDEFCRQPLELARLLESQWGIEWGVDAAQWQQLATTTINNTLRHHDNELPGTLGLSDLMTFSVKVYEALAHSAYRPLAPADLLALNAEFQALVTRHGSELAMLRRAMDDLMALSAESVRIGTLHGEALRTIKQKDADYSRVITERDAIIADRNQIIKDIAFLRFWRLVPRLVRRISRR